MLSNSCNSIKLQTVVKFLVYSLHNANNGHFYEWKIVWLIGNHFDTLFAFTQHYVII